jgi:hypothetical protein
VGPPLRVASQTASAGGANAFALAAHSSEFANVTLRARASVTDSSPSQASPTSSFPQRNASAQANYSDRLNFEGVFQFGYTAFLDVRVRGSLEAGRWTTFPQASGHGVASYTMSIEMRQNINPFNVERFHREFGPTSIDDVNISANVDFTETYHIPLNVGPIDITMSLSSEARTYWYADPFRDKFPHASASADFGNTVRIGNLRVLDANGNSVPFTYTTDSGFDLTGPVIPEPSSVALVALGALAAAAMRRRNRAS